MKTHHLLGKNPCRVSQGTLRWFGLERGTGKNPEPGSSAGSLSVQPHSCSGPSVFSFPALVFPLVRHSVGFYPYLDHNGEY